MTAIYRGRRHVVVGWTAAGMWLEQVTAPDGPSNRIHVSPADADLILDPSREDLEMADAFERGEIGAFEYPDGHTYPPHREIVARRSPFGVAVVDRDDVEDLLAPLSPSERAPRHDSDDDCALSPYRAFDDDPED